MKYDMLYFRVTEGKYIIDHIAKWRIPPLRYVVTKIASFFINANIEHMMDDWTLEQIIYNFAIMVHAYNLKDGQAAHLFKMHGIDQSEYCMAYKILVDCRDIVNGIDITIWTSDKLAKIVLRLSVVHGSFNTSITWAHKNEDGLFVSCNHRDDILEARKYIKDILIEYIARLSKYIILL